MHNYAKTFLLIFITIFVMTGCGATLETEVEETAKSVEEVFKEERTESNNENDIIEYYLPFWYEIIEESEFNILMKNGSKQYILFYNPQEDSSSDIVFNATTAVKDYDFIKTFQHDDKFGYFLVKTIDDSRNEVVVGVGGVKLTGEMKTSSLKSEVDVMMKIANSVILRK